MILALVAGDGGEACHAYAAFCKTTNGEHRQPRPSRIFLSVSSLEPRNLSPYEKAVEET